ncbi:hypothetical protein B0H13DRAFT_2281153, partial [Mycena leptocephala]
MFNNEGVNIVEAISELTSWKFCAASEAPLCLESRLWRQARRGSYDRKSQPRTSDRIRGGKVLSEPPSLRTMGRYLRRWQLIGSALVSQSPHGLLAFTQQLTPSKSPQTVCRVRKVRQLQVQANEGNVVLEVPNPPHFFPVAHFLFLFLFFEVYISAIRTRRALRRQIQAPASRVPRRDTQDRLYNPGCDRHCGNPGHLAATRNLTMFFLKHSRPQIALPPSHKPSAGQRLPHAPFTPLLCKLTATAIQLPAPMVSSTVKPTAHHLPDTNYSSPCLGCEAPTCTTRGCKRAILIPTGCSPEPLSQQRAAWTVNFPVVAANNVLLDLILFVFFFNWRNV